MGRQTPRAATFEIVEIVSRGFAGSLILEQTDFVFRHTATGTNRSSFLYYVLRGDTTIAPSHEIWPTILPLPSFLLLSRRTRILRDRKFRGAERREGEEEGLIGLSNVSSRTLSYRIVSYRALPYSLPFSPLHGQKSLPGQQKFDMVFTFIARPFAYNYFHIYHSSLAMTSHGRGSKIEDRLGRKK